MIKPITVSIPAGCI